MQEYVGVCQQCNKAIYCFDGFINGVVDEESRLTCFECSEEKQENKKEAERPSS